MHFDVKLTEEAKAQYKWIRTYLVYEFGEYVADNFRERITDVFELIAENPHLFPLFNKVKKIRQAVIMKEVSVYYRIDNRQEQPKFNND